METPMNLGDFKKVLIEKVKTEFVNIIPDETIDKFIKDVTNEFIQSEMKNVALAVLHDYTKEQVKRYVDTNAMFRWNNEKNKNELIPEMKNILIEAAPSMFAEVMQQMVQNMMYQLRNQ